MFLHNRSCNVFSIRRASNVEIDAVPGEDCDSMNRRMMIGIFADQHPGEQGWCGYSRRRSIVPAPPLA